MIAALTISLALMSTSDTASNVADRADVACYAVAKGRAATPIRENYMTYSPIVDSLARKQVAWGVRVAGENKVLILTPDLGLMVGIARNTFLRVVDRSQCVGQSLYAPNADDLLTWAGGVDSNPQGVRPPTNTYSTVGCYVMRASKADASPPVAFFGGSSPVGKRYPDHVDVLHPQDGTVLSQVKLAKVERVAFSRCRDAAAPAVDR